ncbi:MAG: hypothetical protein ACRC46_13320 [Thermoguttaceae bacterium]
MGYVFGDAAKCCLCGKVHPFAETWIFISTQESVCDSCAQFLLRWGFCAQTANVSDDRPRSFGIASLVSPLVP